MLLVTARQVEVVVFVRVIQFSTNIIETSADYDLRANRALMFKYHLLKLLQNHDQF